MKEVVKKADENNNEIQGGLPFEQYYYKLNEAITRWESKEWSKKVAKDVLDICIKENRAIVE